MTLVDHTLGIVRSLARSNEFWRTHERDIAGPGFDDLDVDGQAEAWAEADDEARAVLAATHPDLFAVCARCGHCMPLALLHADEDPADHQRDVPTCQETCS